jgi:hypothetical protein
MRSVQYRRWCPPQSPLRIEFPSGLLSELQPPAGSLENSGILYGLRRGREIRVLTAQPEPGEVLESVGVFVSRSRGEVFLTESNLGFFEREGAVVALVIAGGMAGFFVREADESIQTVRSHEEFPVSNPPASPAPPPPSKPEANSAPNRASSLAGLLALIAIPIAALAYLHPVIPAWPPAPISLQVREDNTNQLHVSWTVGRRGILQIVDGAERTTVTVPPDQSSATYARRGNEVEIALIPMEGESGHRESAHFVGQPLPPPLVAPVSMEIDQSKMDLEGLREESIANTARVATLQKAIGRLTAKRR